MPDKKDLQHEQMLKATNQTSNIAIISQMAVLEKNVMRAVESILGYKLDPEQYQKAYKYSRHKLEWQSKLYDMTYDDEYLAIVTAENYEQQIFADYINSISMRRLRV